MRLLCCALLSALLSFSAFAVQDPQNCSVPAGTVASGSVLGNPGFSLPITAQLSSYSCGPTGPNGFGVGNSPAAACNNLSAVNSYGLTVASCFGTGGGGTCQWLSGGSPGNWAGPNGAAGCVTGYVLQANGTCKSQSAIDEDADAVRWGDTVVRNSDGNITSRTYAADNTSWNVTAFDTAGRPASITNTDGSTTTLKYYPNSANVAERTDAGLVSRYVWEAPEQPAVIQSFEGNIYRFTYNDDALHVPKFNSIRVQTSFGDCGTGRTGTAVPCGTNITPIITGQNDLVEKYYAERTHPVGAFLNGLIEKAVPDANANPLLLALPATQVVAPAVVVGVTIGAAVVLYPIVQQAVTDVVDACTAALAQAGAIRDDCEKKRRQDVHRCLQIPGAQADRFPMGQFVYKPPGPPMDKLVMLRMATCFLSAERRFYQCLRGEPQEKLWLP